jgi:uncharacterized protein (DUF2126 family)/transglutaminase-like putative cysteine protease
MALKVVISHKTTYKYDRMVSLSPHIFRLRPAAHSRTPIESYSIKIKPEEQFFNWQQDPFGNYLARIVFPEKTKELSVEVEIVADLKTINPFDFFVEAYAEKYPFDYAEDLKKELIPYLEIPEKSQLMEAWLKEIDLKPRPINDFLVELNMKLHQKLKYMIRMEPGVQTSDETLSSKSGSCRDFAWLLVQTFRYLGFGARFVSGYLVQLTADVKSLDGPSGPAADFTDLHAWAEVYIPGAGWIGLDATSGLLTGEGHIPLACTPSPESAAPVSGFTDVCETEFEFDNSVTRIFESPRVTKPYRDDQWEAIYKLGFQVDRELIANDVRLTMGGEPTFVSVDDMESEQWNTEADGEHKRKLANDLSHKILPEFAPGGLMHHAQGKWYPGEPLPRWGIGIYWRKDGKPFWKKPELMGDMNAKYDFKTKDAKAFATTLCKYLGIDTAFIQNAYEDALQFMLMEAQLPKDIDPTKYKLNDPLERKKLADVLSRGIDKEQGYVLPLNWGVTRWISSEWEFRRERLYLSPGNSPIGLRLPLESLITKPANQLETQFEPDLFSYAPLLPDFHKDVAERVKNVDAKKATVVADFVRTAMCIEERDGKIYIFMPPILVTEAYLDLVACIETTAAELKIPVFLEGYEPPMDNRLERMKITPDPGVIEVNVHPTRTWDELTTNTLALYQMAHISRLGTQKFMLDGRHTGSGGGNHVTLGGATPADSPLLRKPSLLRSLLTFWQHHPGLSYLFSGAFIGPTSQAPRIDEGRAENLYELEIAFSQLPDGDDVPFWLTDRIFRHLLTDITGNTHRAEFCIDKLYSPDSASGRLGILELRAFDMPPHAQMSLTQMLLVRTLVSLFWRKPYKHKLVRWGTELHDSFLLEHYVREDIRDVVEMLNAEGYAFKLDWFDPFFEFRFPLYGMVKINNIDLEVRMAIEPWHVLGEEMTGGGTSRYVDSSVERVQVKVQNFVAERYILTCNGVKVPLSATGTKGEYVSGVRYKAWQPWSALHPTIGVDTPLVFDIVDLWNNHSIGGCTYFVAHPGGRTYETFPVNSYEAESRRINRFWDIGHTQGEVQRDVQQIKLSQESNVTLRNLVESKQAKVFELTELPISPEYPHILDLRQRWTIK